MWQRLSIEAFMDHLADSDCHGTRIVLTWEGHVSAYERATYVGPCAHSSSELVKIDPVILFWVLVLGFGVGVRRTIASLRRAYVPVSAESLVPSSFHNRFNTKLVAFLMKCLAYDIVELVGCTSLVLSEKRIQGPDGGRRHHHQPAR